MAEVIINGKAVEVRVSGKSSAGKEIHKGEIVFPNGDKWFVSGYRSGASAPKNVAPSEEKLRQELEAAKAENAKLKGKKVAKNKGDAATYDSDERTVVKGDDLREQVAAMTKMLASLS